MSPTTSVDSGHRGILAVVTIFSVLAGGIASAAPQKRRTRQPQALIAGTVFEESGRLLRGARVVAVAEADSKQKAQAITDLRGEFAIRVPAGKTRYLVTASAKDFESQQKTVEVYESEKATVNFVLRPGKADPAK